MKNYGEMSDDELRGCLVALEGRYPKCVDEIPADWRYAAYSRGPLSMKTYQAIGDELGVTRQRAHQLEKQFYNALRDYFNLNEREKARKERYRVRPQNKKVLRGR